MAHPNEKTFKDLQNDERYKKLERTLKMVLMKNAERKSSEHGNSSAWPSISSISGDHLDTSCAAMSVQSSRIGSEVVSSSSNLRNIMLHKKNSDGTLRNIATSSENQFPTSKSDVMDDCAMMPPPSMPSVNFGRSKRRDSETGRTPLLNIGMNMERNDNGFSISAPASSVVTSISKATGSIGVNSASGFREKNDCDSRNSYEKSNGNSQMGHNQERIFSKWRVLLNDKAQLIIKGTLECGKVARSKPVIRRLTATSVQSVFKHIYHLKGNLVDERIELPDYVRGKFYNGFPDDWENVYQVWRNYAIDGSRLSFRWPTPITDSDDDINSEITEISYCPSFDKYKKSRSPQKRAKSSKTLPTSSVAENENRSDKARCACSQPQNIGNRPKSSTTSFDNLSHSRCNGIQDRESPRVASTLAKNKSPHGTSMLNLDNSQKSNSLKDIIQEDKLNMIIDNLTNKNCSIEYINKIVEMFECLKYVVSYQSTESNDAEKNNSMKFVNEKLSHTPKEKSRLVEETNNFASVSKRSTKNNDRYENRSGGIIPDHRKIGSPKSAGNLHRARYDGGVRRNLMKHDYESSESEVDYYEDMRRRSFDPYERTRKSQKYKDYRVSNASAKTYHDSKKSFAELQNSGKYTKTSVSGTRYDTSLSEKEFTSEERNKMDNEREFPSPRKRRDVKNRKENIFPIQNYDSSVSITEDDNDERYRDKLRGKRTRQKHYDSSVSITEDEHVDFRDDVRRLGNLKYPKSSAQIGDLEVHGTENVRDDLKRLETRTFTEFNSPPSDPKIGQNTFDQRNYRKISVNVRRIDNHGLANFSDPTSKRQGNKAIDDHPNDHDEDSAYLSLEMKRQKKCNPFGEIGTGGPNVKNFQKIPETLESPLVKIKSAQQIKTKPTVLSSEVVNFHLRAQNGPGTRYGNENNKNSDNTTRRGIDELELNKLDNYEENWMNQKNLGVSSAERAEIVATSPRSTSKERKLNEKGQDGKSARELNSENVEKPTENHFEIGEFGSESNPKQLTAWIPAVICEDDENSKCRLIFEGKLLNEAGHVVNRKFSTDFVKRRVNPKLIETIDHVFYRLVGNLNDTKRAVPKEVIKLCHYGCPGRISTFCEKWKSATADGSNETPKKQHLHKTSVDFLSVPTSSRGRRILPPLNYWSGERVTMKGDIAVYSPGNCQESSIPSSLEQSKEEISIKRTSPRVHSSHTKEMKEKRNDESTADGTKKKDMEKLSPPSASKSTKEAPQSHGSQKSRNAKRRPARKFLESSSESDEDERTKRVLRKRKVRVNDSELNTESTRKLRKSSRNTTSSQSFEKSLSPRIDSFEKPGETEIKTKLRKRQKLKQDETQFAVSGIPKQSTKGRSEVTCKFYQNVPKWDGDLSEDQLSTI